MTNQNNAKYNCLKPLQIGGITLNNRLILAPMAGFTDIAFRAICRELGVSLTITEMVSVKALIYKNIKTEQLLQTADIEKPSCVQLFGSCPENFSEVLDYQNLAKFDIIDINMGCPMPKITKNGDGSALLKNIPLAAKIIEACAKKSRPVTVKIRIGADEDSINVLEMARAVENSGAKMLTIHGRTVNQLYSGNADWEIIGDVAKKIKIPIAGNGDVKSFLDAEEKLNTYNVAAIMVGRGAIGNPWIFAPATDIKKSQILDVMIKQIDYSLKYFSTKYTLDNFRKQIGYYLKSIPDSKKIKKDLFAVKTVEEFKTTLEKSLKE